MVTRGPIIRRSGEVKLLANLVTSGRFSTAVTAFVRSEISLHFEGEIEEDEVLSIGSAAHDTAA
jgi:hypothetical protein